MEVGGGWRRLVEVGGGGATFYQYRHPNSPTHPLQGHVECVQVLVSRPGLGVRFKAKVSGWGVYCYYFLLLPITPGASY